MADFAIRPAAFDGAFCTVDTFRHLHSEKDAVNHLRCVARHLRSQGTYVLGLHLLPDGGVGNQFARWQHARGRLQVHTTMKVRGVDRARRRESIRMSLVIETPSCRRKFHSDYDLRTYSLRQFRDLLKKAGVFTIEACYDHDYDISRPITPGNATEDVVFLLKKAV